MFVKFSNFMSRVSTMIVLGGGFLLPSSHVPGVCSGGRVMELQALHDVPLGLRKPSLTLSKLLLLAWPANLYRRNPRKSNLCTVARAHTPRTAQDHTKDGHVICRSFNSLKGCTCHFCKYAHFCNKNLTDGKACGYSHSSCKHDGN